jgi:hypothetical protein
LDHPIELWNLLFLQRAKTLNLANKNKEPVEVALIVLSLCVTFLLCVLQLHIHLCSFQAIIHSYDLNLVINYIARIQN